MRTHLPTAVLPLVLALAMLSSGCLWLAPYMVPYALLPTGRKPNADVASWPEYTMMVDGTFLTFPFHPTADGKPLYVPERQGEMMVLDMSWIGEGEDFSLLAEGRFEGNSRDGLPGYRLSLGVSLFSTDLPHANGDGRSDALALIELENRKAMERAVDMYRVSYQRLKIGDNEWLLITTSDRQEDSSFRLSAECFALPICDEYYLFFTAAYGRRPRVTEKWYAERRAILRQAVERVRVSDLPPLPKERP